MFERFTALARRTIVRSQEEARLLDHNYIGTEHILLGLLAEPESIGGAVLASFGITLESGREEVTTRIGRGKKAPTGHIPFTPRAKKVLELSLREALKLGHNYIGTEHILLGLIREGDGVAMQILSDRTDVPRLRAAVIEAIPETSGGGEADEGGDETNAVLRWLRTRLTRHATSVPFRPDAPGTTAGTPAVEAALQQAARLAGPRPVGSHHLLLAALDDPDSAASWALASLGVDLDELREKLRTAKLAGTSDEPPEQAGRRQMAIEVSDEIVRIVLTDAVIVEAANEALRAANARAARSAEGAETSEGTGTSESADDGTAAEGAAVAANVIRGDLPAAAGLANVWLELRKTLSRISDPAPEPAGPKQSVKEPDADPLPAEPGDAGAAEAG
jgi:ATP-dependent Clp protease ATP-binding subunit ClpA